jgi:hypothetical protein
MKIVLTAKNAKIYAEDAKGFFFAVFAHPRRPLRFLDYKLNLFSDETPMMRCLTTNQ